MNISMVVESDFHHLWKGRTDIPVCPGQAGRARCPTYEYLIIHIAVGRAPRPPKDLQRRHLAHGENVELSLCVR